MPMTRFKAWLYPAIAFTAGVLTVFSFAPSGIWPLQPICLAALAVIVLRQTTKRQAFFCGWAYGTAAFLSGMYWLFISLHVYGKMNALMAGVGILLLTAFMGLLPAFGCLLAYWIKTRLKVTDTLFLLMVFPACWTIFEWLRGWVFTGLPWLATGYAFTDSPLAGYAPVMGVFGIGLVAAIIGGALASCVLTIRQRAWRMTLAAAVLITLFISIGQTFRNITWTTPYGSPIEVRLLQGNIAQEAKFNTQQLVSMLGQYAEMIMKEKADIIVTPETAIPIYPQNLPAGYLNQLVTFVDTSGSRLALGIPLADSMTSYSNSLAVIYPKDGEHKRLYRYDKHHLVPFGEFVPMGFRWFVNMMHIPLGSFKRGAAIQAPFPVKGQWILPNICYEDIFGEEIAARLHDETQSGRPVASILLNISNIAWFGDTIALPQHLQISRMRSLETGRPMLRSTNTGTTAFIDEYGEVVQQLPPYTAGELRLKVTGTQGITPYIQFGNMLAVLLAVLLIAIACLVSRFWKRD